MSTSDSTDPTPEPGGSPDAATTSSIVYVQAPSVLDRVRANRVGAFAVSLGVSILVGLLLSILVPSKPNVLALMLLGTFVAAAAGFTVRYLTHSRGMRTQAIAFVAAAIGVHIMGVTGSINGAGLGQIGGLLGAGKPGFDDAFLVALALPAVSTGVVISGFVAAIIAGWGKRVEGEGHHHHEGHDHDHDHDHEGHHHH